MNILQITSSGAKLCDEHGESAGIALGFSLGQSLTLEFDLRGEMGESGLLSPFDMSSLPEIRSFYFAVGNAWDATAAPLFLRTEGISLQTSGASTILTVEIPDTGVPPLTEALSGKANAPFTAELGGLDDNGRAVFVWQFQITVGNRIYIGGDAPESVSGDPAYLTAAEVLARIGAASAAAAKNFEIGEVVSGEDAAVSLTAGTSADLALNFSLPRGENGAIITGAGQVEIYVSGGSATLVNTVTGGTATVGITGGTAIALDETFLGVAGKCEYDLIDGNGLNITTSPDVSRQWTGDAYVIALASGFTGGNYAAKPCGVKGNGGNYTAGDGIAISGNTISLRTVEPGDRAFLPLYISQYGACVAVDMASLAAYDDLGIRLPVSSVYPERGGLKIWDDESGSFNVEKMGVGIDIECDIFGGTRSLADVNEHPVEAGNAIRVTGRTVSADYAAGDGIVLAGRTVSAPVFPGGTVSITPESGAASFAVEAGKVYQISAPVSSLTISAVDNSPRESVLFFAFSGGTAAPTVALPQTLGVVGVLPAWEAGKTYVASVQFGNIVAQELTSFEDDEE